MDILDVEANTDSRTGYNTAGHEGAELQRALGPYSYAAGVCEFPPDLFKYVFGTQTWQDNNADCFAETKMASVFYQNPTTRRASPPWAPTRPICTRSPTRSSRPTPIATW
jgi:hypothetical protein